MVSISFKLPDSAQFGGFFSGFFEYIATRQAELESKIKQILVDYARDGHRSLPGRHYQNQTGRLRKSTKAEGSFGFDFQGEINLYVDTSQADYAKYVIDGHGSWEGDPFIEEAAKAKEPEIRQLMIDFLNDAIREFNRR